MDKKSNQTKCNDEQSACEIIELAINDLDTLARAFTLIKDICTNSESETELVSSGLSDDMLH